MILSQIAACARNRVIGKDGDLPWNIPEDMKFFREKTQGHIMIMGRKTFDSFRGKPLPKRPHIVISRNTQALQFSENPTSPVLLVNSIEEALKKAQALCPDWSEEVFIIGGGEIYRQTLPLADRVYLTVIEKDFVGDAHFPEISTAEFKLVESQHCAGDIPFSFNTFERISGK